MSKRKIKTGVSRKYETRIKPQSRKRVVNEDTKPQPEAVATSTYSLGDFVCAPRALTDSAVGRSMLRGVTQSAVTANYDVINRVWSLTDSEGETLELPIEALEDAGMSHADMLARYPLAGMYIPTTRDISIDEGEEYPPTLPRQTLNEFTLRPSVVAAASIQAPMLQTVQLTPGVMVSDPGEVRRAMREILEDHQLRLRAEIERDVERMRHSVGRVPPFAHMCKIAHDNSEIVCVLLIIVGYFIFGR